MVYRAAPLREHVFRRLGTDWARDAANTVSDPLELDSPAQRSFAAIKSGLAGMGGSAVPPQKNG
jgi:hypothetical protein